jgi:hypothetical protein
MLGDWLVVVLRLILGALFTFSGVVKMIDLKKFFIIVAGYGMLPRKLVKPFAYGFPFAEFIIGLLLLSISQRSGLRVPALLALALLIVSTTGVIGALIQKKKMQNCGCYGALVQVPLTWKKLVENLFWIALAVALAWGTWFF